MKKLEAVINKGRTQKLILNSIILSDTPYTELAALFATHTKEDYEAKHVFFLDEGNPAAGDGGKYLPRMFAAAKVE